MKTLQQLYQNIKENFKQIEELQRQWEKVFTELSHTPKKSCVILPTQENPRLKEIDYQIKCREEMFGFYLVQFVEIMEHDSTDS